MNEPTAPVIETHGLTKTYKGVEALKALDLKVHQNSIFGFLGPNGAGKTTTIKLLLGLIRPTARQRIRIWHGHLETERRHPRPHRVPAAGAAFLRIYERPPDPALYGEVLLQGTGKGDRESAWTRCCSWSTWPKRPTAR